MALNIKNAEVEEQGAEIARLTGETKTEAIRRALLERRRRLALRAGQANRYLAVRALMERDVWSQIPAEALGPSVSRTERDAILGLGPEEV